MSTLVEVMVLAWALTGFLMLILWLIQVKTKNAAYVDVGWALGLGISALVYAFCLEGFFLRKLFLCVMIILWACRLVYHLVKRIAHEVQEDKRYQRIREDWKTNQNLKFFFFFQFQAFLDIVLSVGWIAVMRNPSNQIGLVEVLGILIWVIGFVGESVADYQLKNFKLNPNNRGKTCQQGLWNYSRHPNYFFEWLMWVAYAVYALASPLGWMSFLAVGIMYYLLMHLSGVPLAEAQSLKSRGEEYRRYQESTSIFVPWFKRL